MAVKSEHVASLLIIGLVWVDYFSFVPPPADFSVDMVTLMDRVAVLVLDFIHGGILRQMIPIIII